MHEVVVEVVVKPVIVTIVTLATMSVVGAAHELIERAKFDHRQHLLEQ